MLRIENPDFVDIATRSDSHLSLVELVANFLPLAFSTDLLDSNESCNDYSVH